MTKYIDAEKIKYKTMMFPVLDGMIVRTKTIENIVERNDIDKIPSADVQEVKHGKWDGNGYLKNCSLCGTVVNFNEVSIWLYKYCPNCGARMDEEK